MNDNIYCFEFGICDGKMHNPVYSFNFDDIVLFINQHKFDEKECQDYIKIKPYSDEIAFKDEDKMLKLFKFKSNNSNEIFSVMTTEYILEKCVINTGEVLMNAEWFGSLITNENIPIFKIINDMIENDGLPYSLIMDYQQIPDDQTEVYDTDYNYDMIKEELCKSLVKTFGLSDPSSVVQEITIEGYISGFASLI